MTTSFNTQSYDPQSYDPQSVKARIERSSSAHDGNSYMHAGHTYYWQSDPNHNVDPAHRSNVLPDHGWDPTAGRHADFSSPAEVDARHADFQEFEDLSDLEIAAIDLRTHLTTLAF